MVNIRVSCLDDTENDHDSTLHNNNNNNNNNNNYRAHVELQSQ